ncbi:hypothetical protein D3227_08725 [Mesorhizobium waimense]|uniref:Uncharacterized protein n=1 Tax=Mesorhizobium waimense TaxID=1300307 RepID=A0A3A5L3V4_9HYPH|nr:hypothetical protein D3227_08725 [Mesorhizobium waimense]
MLKERRQEALVAVLSYFPRTLGEPFMVPWRDWPCKTIKGLRDRETARHEILPSDRQAIKDWLWQPTGAVRLSKR